MKHIRGAPFNLQTRGKIERWYQTVKNSFLLKNYYLPGHLARQIAAFVDYYKPPVPRERDNAQQPTPTSDATKPFWERGENQGTDNMEAPLATSKISCIINDTNEGEPAILKQF